MRRSVIRSPKCRTCILSQRKNIAGGSSSWASTLTGSFWWAGLVPIAFSSSICSTAQPWRAALNFKFGQRNLLVTFHPVTLEQGTAAEQMTELLAALDMLEDTHLIFTMPNADTDGRVLFRLIEDFVARHPQTAKAFISLGQLRYLSTVAQVDAMVGNSSSGLSRGTQLQKRDH